MTIRAVFMTIPFILMGWIGVLTMVCVVSDRAPAYVVLFPSQLLLENIPESSSILATSIASITDRMKPASHVLYTKAELGLSFRQVCRVACQSHNRLDSTGLAKFPYSFQGLKQ